MRLSHSEFRGGHTVRQGWYWLAAISVAVPVVKMVNFSVQVGKSLLSPAPQEASSLLLSGPVSCTTPRSPCSLAALGAPAPVLVLLRPDRRDRRGVQRHCVGSQRREGSPERAILGGVCCTASPSHSIGLRNSRGCIFSLFFSWRNAGCLNKKAALSVVWWCPGDLEEKGPALGGGGKGAARNED